MSAPLYQPLDTTKSEIRLLGILPEGFSLITVPLDSVPEYAALSYVWGDPHDQKTIVLQGRNVQVGANLASFLARIRRGQPGQDHRLRNSLPRFYQLVNSFILTIVLQRYSTCAWTSRLGPSLHDRLRLYYQLAQWFFVSVIGFLFRQKSQSVPQVVEFDVGVSYLWADAICINQKDMKERTQQVQLMGQIFGSAETVYSWVGPRDQSLAFQSINRLACLAWPRKCVLPARALWRYPSLWCETDKSRFRNKAWNAIDDLLSDRYWNRVWIFQEVVLARQMHLMSSGDSTLSWRDLRCVAATILDLSEKLKDNREKTPFFMSSWASLFLKMYPEWSNVMHMISGIRLATISDIIVKMTPVVSNDPWTTGEISNKSAEDLQYILENLQWRISLASASFNSTDPRDQVYGSLAITHLPIVPDYTKTVSDVYMDYAARWIRGNSLGRKSSRQSEQEYRYSPLAFLANAGAHDVIPALDIPSWVPNFTVKRNYDRHVFGRCHKDYGPVFQEDEKNNPHIVSGTRSLYVWGCQLELISAFTPGTDDTSFEDMGRLKGILKYGSFTSSFISRHPQYVSGISSLEATSRLLAQPHGSGITKEATDCLCQLSRSMATSYVKCSLQGSTGSTLSTTGPIPPFQNWAPNIFKAYFPNTILEQLGLRHNVFAKNPESIEFGVDYHHWFSTLDDTRELTYFETSSGYIGMGTVGLAEGDCLCVIQDCGAPAVVRKTADGHYQFRGTVFVVDLDPQSLIEANGTEPQWFELR